MQSEHPLQRFATASVRAGMLAALVALTMAGCGGSGSGMGASGVSMVTGPASPSLAKGVATTQKPAPARAQSSSRKAAQGRPSGTSRAAGGADQGAMLSAGRTLGPGAAVLVLPVVFVPERTAPPLASLSGAVYGGFRPISGAAVTVYQAGDGYGSGAVPLQSMITDSSGSFTVRFTPPATPKVLYVVALGGDAGLGSNTAIGLMGVVGQSDNLPASVRINEFTTVAAQWALAQFADATGQVVGAPASGAVAFGKAVRQLGAKLADSSSGGPASFWGDQGADEASCTGSLPPSNCDGLERLDTMANILAACVESSGPSSNACKTLFTDSGTPSTGTTLQAGHSIASHPAANVSALFALQSASLPFAPVLASAPSAWTLALNFTDASFSAPLGIAVDGSGNLWVANDSGSVSEFIGVARPVLRPLVACLRQSPSGAVCLP